MKQSINNSDYNYKQLQLYLKHENYFIDRKAKLKAD